MGQNKLLGVAFIPAKWIRATGRRLFFDAHIEESQTNRLVLLGWLAQVGFPLYYWFWAYAFPQPYESLALRVTGMVATLPLVFARRLRHARWFEAYFFCAITFVFPLFFTFMFLMNEGSSAWAQSLLIAVIVLFHFEFKFALLSFVAGTLLAYVGYVLNVGHYYWPHHDMLSSIPIVAFAILTVSIVKIGRNILVEEKLRGMAAALGTVSHELRTPLRSVDASARGLKRYLPVVVDFYEAHHKDAGADPLLSSRVGMMGAALDRIQADVQYMNSAIDLLLANAGDARARALMGQEEFHVGEVIAEAVRRYPFENAQQRQLVVTDLESDFTIQGNPELFMMVVFNLLKNALRAVAKAGKGDIRIISGMAEENNYVIVRDTGCGIPESELPHIFRRLYSYPANMGTGIGLAFCRDTLEAMGATISCRSGHRVYTEFTIRFPRAARIHPAD
jgi:signal transduction histidine kinase